MTPLLAFAFTPLLTCVVWAALCVMSTWAWTHGRTAANLLTTIGAGLLSVGSFFDGFGMFPGEVLWIPLVGAVLSSVGFYLTVKGIVDVKIREMRSRRPAPVSIGPIRPLSAP